MKQYFSYIMASALMLTGSTDLAFATSNTPIVVNVNNQAGTATFEMTLTKRVQSSTSSQPTTQTKSYSVEPGESMGMGLNGSGNLLAISFSNLKYNNAPVSCAGIHPGVPFLKSLTISFNHQGACTVTTDN